MKKLKNHGSFWEWEKFVNWEAMPTHLLVILVLMAGIGVFTGMYGLFASVFTAWIWFGLGVSYGYPLGTKDGGHLVLDMVEEQDKFILENLKQGQKELDRSADEKESDPVE